MKRLPVTGFFLFVLLAVTLCMVCVPVAGAGGPIIINHTSTHLDQVPLSAIQDAKTTLRIAYGHTSHGSQITSGMTGLITFSNAPYGGATYEWNNGGTDGALDLRDTPFSGASDLGAPNYTAWANASRNYLDTHAEVNVVMWSWCGEADTSSANIDTYLSLMNQLETDYPDVKFVYMTGHLVGTGTDGNLNQRNEQIRSYARANNKTLFDFADIESYDPDGLVNYMALNADDGCNYDGGNWATTWQNAHPGQWYNCDAAHTLPLNANMKAYAAWTLWARLGGWDGTPVAQPDKIGVFRPSTHVFYLDDNGNGAWNGAATDRAYTFGLTGDIPVAGDWNNNNITEIGVFRNSTHTFYLDYNGNGAWNGASVDRLYNFGLTGDIPLAGDWNNDGMSEIGVFRPSTHLFYLDFNGDGAWNGASVDRAYNFGLTGDIPVAGDWNNNGISEIGVFRNSTHMFYLDYNGNGVWNGAGVDRAYNFGLTGDMPVAGDWNADGSTEIGVFRNTTHMFYLDYNRNGAWNGASVDRLFNFGLTGDKPVSGTWG